jgi:hypothetical protein
MSTSPIITSLQAVFSKISWIVLVMAFNVIHDKKVQLDLLCNVSCFDAL